MRLDFLERFDRFFVLREDLLRLPPYFSVELVLLLEFFNTEEAGTRFTLRAGEFLTFTLEVLSAGTDDVLSVLNPNESCILLTILFIIL